MGTLSQFQRGASKIGTIASLAILFFGGLYVFNNAPKSPEEQLQKENQSDPEKALIYYLRTAYKYIHNEQPGGSITDVQRTVTKDDWQWFNDNDAKIFKQLDAVNSGSVLGADQKAAFSRIAVLHSLFDLGPDRPDDRIINRELGPERSVFTVRKIEGKTDDIYTDYKVEVVKEGKFWKVKDFGGARTRLDKMQ